MKVCKYSLFDCTDVRDLKDEEDENPTTASTSALQTWHKSRLEGIHSQPVMEVVISNPGNNAEKGKKMGVTCLLAEARKTESDSNKKRQNLVQSLEQHSSKIGLAQVVDFDCCRHSLWMFPSWIFWFISAYLYGVQFLLHKFV